MNFKKLLVVLIGMLLVFLLFSGCSDGQVERGEPTEIFWYLSGVESEGVHQPVWDKVNEILEKKYNIHSLNIMLFTK